MLYREEYEETELRMAFDSWKPLFYSLKNEKALAADAFLEDTHVLNDGIRELARDHKKSQKSNSQKKKSIVELLQK